MSDQQEILKSPAKDFEIEKSSAPPPLPPYLPEPDDGEGIHLPSHLGVGIDPAQPIQPPLSAGELSLNPRLSFIDLSHIAAQRFHQGQEQG